MLSYGAWQYWWVAALLLAVVTARQVGTGMRAG
jgi:predicted alpha-1,6-mannanase (GH76 family)